MKKCLLLSAAVCLFISSVSFADTFAEGTANEFEIDFVTISGDASSANGTNISQYSSGDSRYKAFVDPGNYRMGTYEISNAQWTAFRNSLDVPITGNPSHAYDESSYFNGDAVPANRISWYEAAQFVNWLNTSTGHQAAYKFTGTQGTGDYTQSVWDVTAAAGGTNLYRHKDAYYFLPTEDEWIKAAYWNGTNLQTYSNASGEDLIAGMPDSAKWNYDPSVGFEPWAVDSGIDELNGTKNMMGNVSEWMEGLGYSGDATSDFYRGIRGGSYGNDEDYLRLTRRGYDFSFYEFDFVGFRVASVPEPCSLLLLGLGGLILHGRKQ